MDGKTVEMYAPLDLWRHAQHSGQWIDEDSNTLVLATMRLPVPPEFPRQHVPRPEYDAGMKNAAQVDWDKPDTFLMAWVTAFAGARPSDQQAITKRSSRLRDLYIFSIPEPSPFTHGYAFRLSRMAPAQRNAVTNWFCLLLSPSTHIKPDTADAAVQTELIPSLGSCLAVSPVPATPRPDAPQAAGKADTGRSPEFLESRRQVASSIANMKDWWMLETENYILLSNLKNRKHVMVRELESSVEVLRNAFESFIPLSTPPGAVSVIRLFATPEEYTAYVGEKMSWTGGAWIPDRKELVVKPQDWGSSKEQRESILRVTYHEAFHQYIHFATSPHVPAVWFNEGHACFFENIEVRDRRLTMQENERFVEKVVESVGKSGFSLKPLLTMSYETFYNPRPSDRERNYALAWALVYYMRRGTQVDKHLSYASIPGQYLTALAETGDPGTATDKAFGGVDQAALQGAFVAFWQSRNKRGEARRLPLPSVTKR